MHSSVEVEKIKKAFNRLLKLLRKRWLPLFSVFKIVFARALLTF